MDVLISASLITAFLAGMAALFEPCCIGVLLPTYLSSIFKHKIKIFFMTFVFFLGILIVFLPLGLGFGALGTLLMQLHDIIFWLGGLFLIFLSLSMWFGLHLQLPFHFTQKLENQSFSSVLVLGIFSGLAVTCCAPVLAGVLALSILPASVFWGGMYAFTYVLGMLTPLFLIALFLDKINFTDKFSFFQRGVTYKLGGKEISLTYANVISASIFLVAGVLILILNMTGNLESESAMQIRLNILLKELVDSISSFLAIVPGFTFVLLFLLLFLVILRMALKQLKSK